MAHGRVKLSGDEMNKFRIIKDILEKKISQKKAAEKLGLSTRQVRRLQKRVKQDGSQGVVHRLVGRASNNSLGVEKKEQIKKLWSKKYKRCEFNFTHFTQKLNEDEGIKVSKDTVRTLLRKENLVDKKLKKRATHRKQRERRERMGELLQQDTSPHDWLSTGEKQHLVAVVDDATSTALYGKLYSSDGTLPNMEAMDYIFRNYGLPEALYTDLASWFHYSEQGRKLAPSHKSLRQGRDGKKGETQIGRALKTIGVELIPAYSPQAKGRIERLNGTFQDRLISELRLHNITHIDKANEYIANVFIPDYNKRFSVPPAVTDSAFLQLANPDCLNDVLCLKFQSTVRNDNVVSKSKYYKLQLLPGTHRLSWAKAKVNVRLHLDGTVSVRHSKSNELIPFEILELKSVKEPKHGKTLFTA